MNLRQAVLFQRAVSVGDFVHQDAVRIQTNNMIAFVFPWYDESVVVIKGTDEFNDWWKINGNLGKSNHVHKGFAEGWRQIRTEVRHALNHFGQTRYVTLIGHSMGGAVAQVAAMELPQAIRVITFGQPRVFDKTMAKTYNARFGECTTRVVNSDDLVPTVPWVLGSYRHTDGLLYLSNGSASEKEPWYRTINAFFSSIPKVIGLRKYDHDIESYVEAVHAYQEGIDK